MLPQPHEPDGLAEGVSGGNPRRANGTRRTATLRWLRAQGRPCWICQGPIDYGLPPGDPLAFECDELVPVSRGGSPLDRGNVEAAHRCCNQWRGNKPVREVERLRSLARSSFGQWRSPLEFVDLVKAAARRPGCGPERRPPSTTTDW